MQLKTGMALVAGMIVAAGSYADVFGTGANEFELTFQPISGGSKPSGNYGNISYAYSIGTHEITADQWQKYINASGGPVGSGTAYDASPGTSGSQAVNNVSWYEAAQFVNWLNTSTGNQAAYSFDASGVMSLWGEEEQSSTSAFRHKDALYALPSEDEWVKAAYWNGSSLQTYATSGDVAPVAGSDANFANAIGSIWDVGSGNAELNGTYDMMGNVWEWSESGYTAPDDSVSEYRALRGGAFNNATNFVISSKHLTYSPNDELSVFGFRVAAVPEPSTLAFVGVFGGGLWMIRRFFPM